MQLFGYELSFKRVEHKPNFIVHVAVSGKHPYIDDPAYDVKVAKPIEAVEVYGKNWNDAAHRGLTQVSQNVEMWSARVIRVEHISVKDKQ